MSQAWGTEVLILMLILGAAWYCYNRRISGGKTHVATPAARAGRATESRRPKWESALLFFQEFADAKDSADDGGRHSPRQDSTGLEAGYAREFRRIEPLDEFARADKLDAAVAESLEFTFESHRFKISERRWSGMNDETHAEFAFFEDGTEVFAIRCLIDVDAHGARYRCCKIATFGMQGNWAKALLGFHARARIGSELESSGLEHFRADGTEHRLR